MLNDSPDLRFASVFFFLSTEDSLFFLLMDLSVNCMLLVTGGYYIHNLNINAKYEP